ncbi:MAG TPA: hypothetical protein VFI30_03230 [Nocardioidaceae bacterium]|nr:hypothetical protein [Nocardioidaceae bacterium]
MRILRVLRPVAGLVLTVALVGCTGGGSGSGAGTPAPGTSSASGLPGPGSYDEQIAFRVTDAGLVSEPLPANLAGAIGKRIEFTLSNDSSRHYHIEVYDGHDRLLGHQDGAAGSVFAFVTTFHRTGLYRIKLYADGAPGSLTWAPFVVTTTGAYKGQVTPPMPAPQPGG